MPIDIFDFWGECTGDARTHPRDEPVFKWAGDMGFDLRCLPSNIWGKLRSAPVVLLYLSPGFAEFDLEYASRPDSHAIYVRRRQGIEPLDSRENHEAGWKWWTQRTKVFGPPGVLRDRLAILNLGAYHSKTFDAYHALTALPSSRAALAWAHEVLFPQALAGDKVVICMRAAIQWGLEPGRRYGRSLYVPPMVRGGYMKRAEDYAEMRTEIIEAVRQKLDMSPNS